MNSLLQSEEFKKMETEFPFLRRAREVVSGLRGLNYIIVDIETTGLEPTTNEIIEIAALKVEEGEIVDALNPLIRINFPLPKEIVNLTEITDEMLEDGKEKNQVMRDFLDFIEDYPLVAHNTDFDIPFLKYHCKQTLGEAFNNPLICTLKLSRSFVPGLSGYKLLKVAEHFQVPAPVLHRAMADAEITFQVWLNLIGVLEKQGVMTLDSLMKVVN